MPRIAIAVVATLLAGTFVVALVQGQESSRRRARIRSTAEDETPQAEKSSNAAPPTPIYSARRRMADRLRAARQARSNSSVNASVSDRDTNIADDPIVPSAPIKSARIKAAPGKRNAPNSSPAARESTRDNRDEAEGLSSVLKSGPHRLSPNAVSLDPVPKQSESGASSRRSRRFDSKPRGSVVSKDELSDRDPRETGRDSTPLHSKAKSVARRIRERDTSDDDNVAHVPSAGIARPQTGREELLVSGTIPSVSIETLGPRAIILGKEALDDIPLDTGVAQHV